MRYRSTRGGQGGLSFEDVILSGYAPDGGMYMPETIPLLSAETINSWADAPYVEIVKRVAALYVGEEIPSEDLNDVIARAYSTFSVGEVITCCDMQPGITLLEMFHGQTMAFKDLSMCCSAQLIEYFLKKRSKKAIVLCATSGDTGSSALQAIRHTKSVDIVVVLPKNRISEIQELQMTTVVSDNCHVIRADGTSDDIDIPVKAVLCDKEFAARYNLGSLNSVNWARMMVQIAHHFYAYFQARRRDPSKSTVVVIPTGGLGNATAACIARCMGLPLQIVCSVTNDALKRAIDGGDYSVGELNVSLAAAINIQMPYNLERILYLFSDMNTKLISDIMSQYDTIGKVTLPDDLLIKIRSILRVELISDEEILEAVRKFHQENDNYLICPHTATAVAVAYNRLSLNDCNAAVLGVASYAKFAEVISKAGLTHHEYHKNTELRSLPTRYTDWDRTDDWAENLRSVIVKIHNS